MGHHKEQRINLEIRAVENEQTNTNKGEWRMGLEKNKTYF